MAGTSTQQTRDAARQWLMHALTSGIIERRTHVPECGCFLGHLDPLWLDDGRFMQLKRPFGYEDPQGCWWVAPAGTLTNGASIPRFFWRIFGAPFTGLYRDIAAIHDAECVLQAEPWRDVHAMFYWGCRAGGCSALRSWLMWVAVRLFGPRW